MNFVNTIKVFGLGTAFTFAVYLAPVAIELAAQDVGLDLGLVSEAMAQGDAKQKTRRLPGISQSTMKDLAEVTELVSPDTEANPQAKPNFSEALKVLQKMEKSCKDKCNPYEIASIYRFYAYAYYSLDDYPKAINAYKKILQQSPEIPVGVELEALNSVSQLLYSQEDYDGALKYLNDWMELSTIVGADKFFFRGSIYYSMNNKSQALKDVNTAISMVEKSGKVPNEQWYGLQLALYLEKEDYKSGKQILEKLVRHHPKIKWWSQYANINGMLELDKLQLASLDAINVMDGFSSRQEIVNAAYLYLAADVPYKAAKILEKGMKQGKVDRNVKNLKTLATAFRQAKEYKEAVAVYSEAAEVAKKEDRAKKDDKKYNPEEGNIYSELAAVYSMMDDSKGAIEAGKKALAAGELKRACEVHTNMGISYVDLHQYQSAINSFEKARQDKQCKAIVANWIRYAENEKRQQEELARSM